MTSITMAGIFLIGLGVGVAIPTLPPAILFLKPWLWIILIIVGIILIIKSH